MRFVRFVRFERFMRFDRFKRFNKFKRFFEFEIVFCLLTHCLNGGLIFLRGWKRLNRFAGLMV